MYQFMKECIERVRTRTVLEERLGKTDGTFARVLRAIGGFVKKKSADACTGCHTL